MAIFGYFGPKNRFLTASFSIISNFWGQWRFAPSALCAERCFAPFLTLTGASRRLGGPKMAKNGQNGAKITQKSVLTASFGA